MDSFQSHLSKAYQMQIFSIRHVSPLVLRTRALQRYAWHHFHQQNHSLKHKKQVGAQQLESQQVGAQQEGAQQGGSQQLSGQSSTCQESGQASQEPGRQTRLP